MSSEAWMSNDTYLPYGRQEISEQDISAVCEVLRSSWLTTGPVVEQFEEAVCRATGAEHGIAVCNGTAALHAAMAALELSPGDEVIVPSMTFAATANCILYQGGTPVFADVGPDTLLLDPAASEAAITPRTKAIIGVDYAGQPCDWAALRAIANRHGLALVADSCHAIGAEYRGKKVGTLADITLFSFHPVKHITTGEGGMAVTADEAMARRMRVFRNHGITTDHRQREKSSAWFYEMTSLGYNYRLTDIQCALGLSQLRSLPDWIQRRNSIAALYDDAFAGKGIQPLARQADVLHAYHLYVVRLPGAIRDMIFQHMRNAHIGVNVHYIPVHLHPYYRERLGTREGMCPNAEAAYHDILSLPMFPALTDADIARVAGTLSVYVFETLERKL